jgi:serine phosphatase RsbU (regulator of sigma subunit)
MEGWNPEGGGLLSVSFDISEDAAVQRAYDARNLAWLRVVVSLLVFVVIGQAIHAGVTKPRWPMHHTLPFLNLLLIVAFLGVLDELAHTRRRIARLFRRPAALVARNVRAWTLGFLAAEYLLLIAYASGGGWVAWVFIFPLAMLGLRLLPVEALLMHGFFVVAAAIEAVWTHGVRMDMFALVAMALMLNLLLMAIELFGTRRYRTEFVTRFRDEQRDFMERQRMRDELRFAREVQLSMLPDSAPALDWIDFAATSLPATEVGGDYYDFFVLDAARIAIVCGDVAGHGLASGLVLAALRSGFMLLRDQLGEPARVLRRLHDLVKETSRRRMLVTTAIVLIDREQRRAVVTSAGHPPMIVKRAGGAAEAIELFAPPLGVHLPIETPERTLSFGAGDAFVLQSDGIYESLNAAGESYGTERVLDVVRAQPDGAIAAAMRDAILADVERFRGAVAQADDITLVVARIV